MRLCSETPDISFGACEYSASADTSNGIKRNSYKGIKDSVMYPFVFCRDREFLTNGQYYEILQDLLHVLKLHWVESKNAYCIINKVGNIEEKIVVVNEIDFSTILIDRYILELYMGYGNFSLLRFFHVHKRFDSIIGCGRSDKYILSHSEDKKTFMRDNSNINESDLEESWNDVRVSNLITTQHSVQELEDKENEREYEKFWIYNWKNKRVVEWSSSPDELDSYFKDTGKPLQTSPAFFNADVLLKYKNDPEKYEIEDRYIYCKGAWDLGPYGINKEGQVHVYISHLGELLPYTEQLQWKQYNEKPNGPISERAFKTDFLGEWNKEYDPLEAIKNHFRHFPKLKDVTCIWLAKGSLEDLFNAVQYVTSGKISEYRDFLLGLTILVVEGLQKKSLAVLVSDHEEFDKKMGSIGLLRLFLLKNGVNNDGVNKIVKPLRELQAKRSKYSGHRDAKPDFDLNDDSRKILETIEKAIKELISVIKRIGA